MLCEYDVIESISSAGRESAALRAACHALAHGPSCPCPPAKPDKHQLTRWQHAVEGLLKLVKALSKMAKRNPAGYEKVVARLRGRPFLFDFATMRLEASPPVKAPVPVVPMHAHRGQGPPSFMAAMEAGLFLNNAIALQPYY